MIGSPVPFEEALARHDVRRVMPTALSTAEIQRLPDAIRRSSFFSARTLLTDYLEQAKAAIRQVLNPQTAVRPPGDPREGEPYTEGLTIEQARANLREYLTSIGYEPNPDEAGTLKDLSSQARVDLVVRTNVGIAQGYGYWKQGQDPAILDEWPASELFRAEGRGRERDWPERWLAAARAVGDTDAIAMLEQHDRMIARKDSPIWQALGDGAGGFEDDALHNPYPPFAFNSGMDVRDIDRAEAMDLGLLGRDDAIIPQSQDFAPQLAGDPGVTDPTLA